MSQRVTAEMEARRCEFPPGLHLLDTAHYFTPIQLYKWQRDVLAALAQDHSRVIFTTPNESGKTSVIAPCFLFGVMVAFPGAYCYATSASEDQLREQLFQNQLFGIVTRMPGWTISTSSLTVTAPNGSRLKGYRCVDPGKVEGMHGYWDRLPDNHPYNPGKPYYRPCAYWADEIKSIKDPIHDAIRRINPDFFGAASTPGLRAGFLYNGIDPDKLDRVVQQRREKRVSA